VKGVYVVEDIGLVDVNGACGPRIMGVRAVGLSGSSIWVVVVVEM